MFHTNTAGLIAYWTELRGARLAPFRSELEPAAFKEVMSQVFILGRMAPGDFRFRLAGGVMCDAHKRNLRGEAFLGLWVADEGRLQVKISLEQMLRNGEPIVVNVGADAGPFATSIEIFLAPLAGPDGAVDRVLGLFQPLLPLSVLHDRPIEALTPSRVVKALDHAQDTPKLRLAAISGRLVG